jgi:hypothetical protein
LQSRTTIEKKERRYFTVHPCKAMIGMLEITDLELRLLRYKYLLIIIDDDNHSIKPFLKS